MEKGFEKISVTLTNGKSYICFRKVISKTKSPRVIIKYNGREAEHSYSKLLPDDLQLQTKLLLSSLIND